MSEAKTYMSNLQKKRLADIMASKSELRSGKFTTSFTKLQAQKEWEEIADILNGLPGARKPWKSWRKSWQDLLSKTKVKKGALNKSLNRTGGGRPLQPLDEIETNIVSLIDPRSISGHWESQESEAVFDFDSHLEMVDTIEESEAQSMEAITVVEIVSDEADAAPPQPPQPPQQEKAKQKKINLKTLMKEKVELKKKLSEAKIQFYKELIEEKKKQTSTLEQIAMALALQGQSNVV